MNIFCVALLPFVWYICINFFFIFIYMKKKKKRVIFWKQHYQICFVHTIICDILYRYRCGTDILRMSAFNLWQLFFSVLLLFSVRQDKKCVCRKTIRKRVCWINIRARLRCSRVENALKKRLLFITNCPPFILAHLILQYTHITFIYIYIYIYGYMQMWIAAGDLSYHHLLNDGLFVFLQFFFYSSFINVYVQ